MKDTDRRIKESPIFQGTDEQIIYTLDTTPWGDSPTGISVVLKDSDGSDVSSTKLSGSPSVSGNIISTPTVKSLVVDAQYRLEIKFVIDGNTLETFADVFCET